MADIKLNLDELNQLYGDLLSVSIQFDNSPGVSRHLATAVGHDALADRVNAFAGAWDDRRREITESLDVLWRTVKAIQDTFEQVDSLMASKLTEAGTS